MEEQLQNEEQKGPPLLCNNLAKPANPVGQYGDWECDETQNPNKWVWIPAPSKNV